MATLGASINHYVTASVKSSMDVFASIFHVLDTFSEDIGTRRIAYSTGSGGNGMNYSNTADAAGNNAWACFYFYRADTPFFALFQAATSSLSDHPFGTIDGSRGTLLGSSSYVSNGGVGAQFAAVPFRLGRDIDVWAGTRQSNGTDNKNFPCPWVTKSNPDLVVFPRANTGDSNGTSLGGPGSENKSHFTCLVSQNQLTGSDLMWHIVFDSNTFMFIKNFGSSSASFRYSGMYYGKYVEGVGFNSKMRYFLLNHVSSSDGPMFVPFSSGVFYGVPAGTSTFDGGLAHPSPQSGCFSVCLDAPTFINSTRFSPARLFSSQSNYPVFDEFPWAVGAYDEAAKVFGFAGSVSFMRVAWGIETHTVFSQSFRAAFGNNQTDSLKTTVPWPSGSQFLPGTNLHRTGTQIIFQSTY